MTIAPKNYIWWENRIICTDAAPEQAAVKLRQVCGQFGPELYSSGIGHAVLVLERAQGRHCLALPVLDNLFGEPEIEPQAPMAPMQVSP